MMYVILSPHAVLHQGDLLYILWKVHEKTIIISGLLTLDIADLTSWLEMLALCRGSACTRGRVKGFICRITKFGYNIIHVTCTVRACTHFKSCLQSSALRVKKCSHLVQIDDIFKLCQPIQCENYTVWKTLHTLLRIWFVNIAVGIVTCDHCPRGSCQEIHTLQYITSVI